MNHLRPYPITNDNDTTQNVLMDTINSMKLSAGNGIDLKHSYDGYTIAIKNKPKTDNLTYVGNYNFDAEYFPNEVIIVPSGVTYKDQTGATLNIPIGTYICVQHIPAASNDNILFTSSVVPVITSAGGTATDYEANNYRWYNVNTYYPTTQNFTPTVVSNSGYNINASQSFWAPLVGGSNGLNPRGLWSDTIIYNVNDMVIIQSGVNAGTYYSTITNNVNNPASGNGWMQISDGNIIGNWF